MQRAIVSHRCSHPPRSHLQALQTFVRSRATALESARATKESPASHFRPRDQTHRSSASTLPPSRPRRSKAERTRRLQVSSTQKSPSLRAVRAVDARGSTVRPRSIRRGRGRVPAEAPRPTPRIPRATIRRANVPARAARDRGPTVRCIPARWRSARRSSPPGISGRSPCASCRASSPRVVAIPVAIPRAWLRCPVVPRFAPWRAVPLSPSAYPCHASVRAPCEPRANAARERVRAHRRATPCSTRRKTCCVTSSASASLTTIRRAER